MKKKLFLLFLTLPVILIFQNCYMTDKNNKNLYMFYLKNYYSSFGENKKTYEAVRKNLLKQFFNLHEIKLNSISALSNELENKKTYKNGLIFLDEYFYSILVKSARINYQGQNIRLLTYNMPVEDIYVQAKVPVFNIAFEKEILYKTLIKILKKHSKDKISASDCGIIINPDFELSRSAGDYFAANNIKPDIFEAVGNSPAIDEWLKEKKRNAVIFFGYNANEKILNLSKADYKDTIFTEIITEYCKGNRIINYNITIDWEKAVNYGLNSSSFDNFIKDGSKTPLKNNIYNYTVKKNILIIQKYPVTIYDKIE